jgi:ribonuclease HI
MPVTGAIDAKWSKPGPMVLKLNVDDSFYMELGSGSIGAIIRDYEGAFMAGSCRPLSHVASASMAEAIAMKEGLQLAQNISCNMIMVESDSIEIIDACTCDSRWWNASSAVYVDCIDLASSIASVSFRSCPREANQVAHEISRFSFFNNQTCNWVNEPLRFILDRLINDVTIL